MQTDEKSDGKRVGSTDGLERCPNCGNEHSNAPNWYCQKCSERLQRYTGKGYVDEDGLRSNAKLSGGRSRSE